MRAEPNLFGLCRVQPKIDEVNFAVKREKSQACLNYAEREQNRRSQLRVKGATGVGPYSCLPVGCPLLVRWLSVGCPWVARGLSVGFGARLESAPTVAPLNQGGNPGTTNGHGTRHHRAATRHHRAATRTKGKNKIIICTIHAKDLPLQPQERNDVAMSTNTVAYYFYFYFASYCEAGSCV